VKKFIFQDLDSYGDAVKFVPVGGAAPVVVFYDGEDKEVFRQPLDQKWSRAACNELLEKHGFHREEEAGGEQGGGEL